MRIVQTLEVWYYFCHHHHHQQQQLVIAAQNNIEPNGFFVFGFCCFRRRNHNKATKKKKKLSDFLLCHCVSFTWHSHALTTSNTVNRRALRTTAHRCFFLCLKIDGWPQPSNNEREKTNNKTPNCSRCSAATIVSCTNEKHKRNQKVFTHVHVVFTLYFCLLYFFGAYLARE